MGQVLTAQAGGVGVGLAGVSGVVGGVGALGIGLGSGVGSTEVGGGAGGGGAATGSRRNIKISRVGKRDCRVQKGLVCQWRLLLVQLWVCRVKEAQGR